MNIFLILIVLSLVFVVLIILFPKHLSLFRSKESSSMMFLRLMLSGNNM